MRLALLSAFLCLILPGAVAAQGLPPLVPERSPQGGPPPAQPGPDSGEAPRPRPVGDRPQPESRERRAPRRRRLSDERTRSRWAYVVDRTWARTRPHRRGRLVKRLGLRTPDGTREVVLALAERRTSEHGVWLRVRLPMRPNGTTGWVRRRSLGRLRIARTFLRVDRARLRATLFRSGRAIWRAPIGIGQARWPTPGGRFYVRERLVPTDPDGLYGVFAFGLSAYSETLTDWPRGGMIGIHGTNQPELLPGRVSHGCVRVANGRIARLRRLMGLGTPVEIR